MGILGRLVVLFGFLLVVFLLLVRFSIGQFVIGVIHGDRAIRQSEGRNSEGFRSSGPFLGIQDIVNIAGYISSTK
jgi:hypothetical protein